MPTRVQLRRTKGWKMPPNTVSVARPTKWGNPYVVGDWGSPKECVDAYELGIGVAGGVIPYDDLHELRGKNLACFCPLDQPCHADVLLDLANRPPRHNLAAQVKDLGADSLLPDWKG